MGFNSGFKGLMWFRLTPGALAASCKLEQAVEFAPSWNFGVI